MNQTEIEKQLKEKGLNPSPQAIQIIQKLGFNEQTINQLITFQQKQAQELGGKTVLDFIVKEQFEVK